ncbi:hypothetical protein AB0392_17385 [Nonomuraea angiospora]|uniref:hypothetical protein n=1 Tax=Nonomuraea angiospora TaxID=46172 RepID=UPI00344D2940
MPAFDGYRLARVEEYRAVIAEAGAAARARPGERSRAVKWLQAELRRIGRRDYFPPAEREADIDDEKFDAPEAE